VGQGQPIEGQLNYFGKLADQKDQCGCIDYSLKLGG
jgi:hypothetical protein